VRASAFVAGVFFLGMVGAELFHAVRWWLRAGRWLSFRVSSAGGYACLAALAFYGALGDATA
jgi:hypothetical protein